MALALPVVALLLFGVLDFCRAIYEYNTIANAAREGARYAIAHPTDANRNSMTRQAVLQLAIGVGLQNNTSDICIKGAPSSSLCDEVLPSYGDPVTVQVNHRFYAVTPFINELTGGGIQMRATSVMYSQ